MATQNKINIPEVEPIKLEDLDKIAQHTEEAAKELEKLTEEDINEETFEELNEKAEGFKGVLIGAGTWIADVLGFTQLQASINAVMLKALAVSKETESFKETMIAAEAEVRLQIKGKIAALEMRGTNKSLKKAIALKAFIGEDGAEAGTGQGIFGAAISGIWWIADKFVKGIKKLFNKIESKNEVLGKVCHAIRTVYGYIKKGAKFIIRWTGRCVSWALTGVLAIGVAISATILWIYTKIVTAIKGKKNTDDSNNGIPHWFTTTCLSEEMHYDYEKTLETSNGRELYDTYYEYLMVKSLYLEALGTPLENLDLDKYIAQFNDIDWDSFNDYYVAMFAQAPIMLEKDYIRAMAMDMSKKYPDRNANDFAKEIMM